MPARYCQACGTELNDDASYCPECGAAVGEDDETTDKETSTDGDSWDWDSPRGPF